LSQQQPASSASSSNNISLLISDPIVKPFTISTPNLPQTASNNLQGGGAGAGGIQSTPLGSFSGAGPATGTNQVVSSFESNQQQMMAGATGNQSVSSSKMK